MTGRRDFDWSQGDKDYDRILAEERATGDAAEAVMIALEKRGLTQSALAEACNITPGALSQRLNGRTNMTVRLLAQMLHRLNFSLQFQLVDLADGDTITVRDYPHESSYDGLLKPQFTAWAAPQSSGLEERVYGWR